jgi:O-antigen ligase
MLVLGYTAAAYVSFALLGAGFILVAGWGLWNSRRVGMNETLWSVLLFIILPFAGLFQTIDIGSYIPTPLPFSLVEKFPLVVLGICALFVVIGSLIPSLMERGERAFRKGIPLLMPFIIYTIAVLMSIASAPKPSRALAPVWAAELSFLELLYRIITPVVFYYLGYGFVRNLARARQLAVTIVMLGLADSIAGFWQFFRPDDFAWFMSTYGLLESAGYSTHAASRIIGLWGWSFQSGAFLVLAMSASIALWQLEKTKLRQYAIVCGLVAMASALLLSGSRSAMLGSIVMIVIFSFQGFERRKISIKVLTMLVFFGIASIWLLSVLLGSLPSSPVQDSVRRTLLILSEGGAPGLSYRLLIWQQGIEVFARHPLFGVGMGNFIFYNPLPVLLGPGAGHTAHNFIVQTLAETGVIGMIVTGWLLFSAFQPDLQILPKALPNKYRVVIASMFAACIGFLTQALFDNLFSGAWGLLAFFWLYRGAAWSLCSAAARLQAAGGGSHG